MSVALAKSRWNLVREHHRVKHRIPTLKRLFVTATLWVALVFVGGSIFHALESWEELKSAARRAYVEEVAGLRDSSWREPMDDGVIGCKGHGPACTGFTTEETCMAFVVEAAPVDDNKCFWSATGGGRPKGEGKGDGKRRQLAPVLGDADHPEDGRGEGLNCTVNGTELNTMAVASLGALLKEMQVTCKQQPPLVDSLSWSFAGSMFFSLQMMTTVGYGTHTPVTPGGKAASVLFGTVGIAFTGYALGIFTVAIDALLELAHRKLLFKRHQKRFLLSFKFGLTGMLVVLYVILVSLVAIYREGFAPGDAIYFVWVSVSTVGFGDFALRDSSIGDVLLQCLLFFPGLALFAEFIALGNEYSRMADAKARRVSAQLSPKRGSGRISRQLTPKSKTASRVVAILRNSTGASRRSKGSPPLTPTRAAEEAVPASPPPRDRDAQDDEPASPAVQMTPQTSLESLEVSESSKETGWL